MSAVAPRLELGNPTDSFILSVVESGAGSTEPVMPLSPAVRAEMISSIARTSFLGAAERIPATDQTLLEERNEEVRQNFGDDARSLIIPGPDAIVFPGSPADIVNGRYTGIFLELLVKERSLRTTREYAERFRIDAPPEDSKSHLSDAKKFFNNIADTEGNDFIRTNSKRGLGHAYGIDDFVVTDVRNSEEYLSARFDHSKGLWTAHVLEGDQEPEIYEPAILIAAWAVRRSIMPDVDSLADEQLWRYLDLGEKVDELVKKSGYDAVLPQPLPRRSNTRGSNPSTTQDVVPAVPPETITIPDEKAEDDQSPDDTSAQNPASSASRVPWRQRSACAGPQRVYFFPPSQVERKDERLAREDRAKTICAMCPVRTPCLEWALSTREPEGIWGGLDEAERKRVVARSAKAV